MTEEVILDFSEEKKGPFKFRLDDDLFEAYGEIPAEVAMATTDMDFLDDVVDIKTGKGVEVSPEDAKKLAKANRQLFQRYARFIDSVLMEESRQLFAARMLDPKNPITMTQMQRTYMGLVRHYGEGRPTEPSSSSSNGHDGTDTNSTDEVSIGDLTRSASPPTDS